jgi:chromosome partitioning protein
MSQSIQQQDFYISVSDLAAFLGWAPAEVKERFQKISKEKLKTPYLLPQQVRTFLMAEGYSYPQKTVSIQMLKGGVAKTTSILNMGLRAAMYGARVLFIDLDQQIILSSFIKNFQGWNYKENKHMLEFARVK